MNRLLLVAASCILITVSSCKFGPAHPDVDGPSYLRQHGYSEETISKLLANKEIDEQLLQKLAVEESTDVRFLVAQNPHLPEKLYDALLNDDDSFVKGGAAANPRISRSHAIMISRSGDHTVGLYLARNPNVDKDVLIDLHEKYGMELVWFAFNPKCPEVGFPQSMYQRE